MSDDIRYRWTKTLIQRGLTKDLWLIGNGKECYYAVTIGTPRVLRGVIIGDNCIYKTNSVIDAMNFMRGERI